MPRKLFAEVCRLRAAVEPAEPAPSGLAGVIEELEYRATQAEGVASQSSTGRTRRNVNSGRAEAYYRAVLLLRALPADTLGDLLRRLPEGWSLNRSMIGKWYFKTLEWREGVGVLYDTPEAALCVALKTLGKEATE